MTSLRKLDFVVVVATTVVFLAAVCAMPFMPHGENGDPIGVAAFAAVCDLIYLIGREWAGD